VVTTAFQRGREVAATLEGFTTRGDGQSAARRWPMPERAFVIHFPNGDFEYDVRPTAAPEVGEMVRRRGALWRVTTRETQDVVVSLHVEAVDEPSGPQQTSAPDAT
jgi:hypothetical protein